MPLTNLMAIIAILLLSLLAGSTTSQPVFDLIPSQGDLAFLEEGAVGEGKAGSPCHCPERKRGRCVLDQALVCRREVGRRKGRRHGRRHSRRRLREQLLKLLEGQGL